MNFRIKLEPISSIEQKASGAIASRIVRNLNTKRIENETRYLLQQSIERQREWINLLSGDPRGLGADFGIPAGSEGARLQKFLEIWLDSVNVTTELRLFKKTFRFKIFVNAIKANYEDVLDTQEALVYNINKNNTQTLPWLEWLLLFGDRTVIKDHSVRRFARPVKGSRSGKALMKLGGSFAVNPLYSGTLKNNFITDAVKRTVEDPEFRKIFEDAVYQAVK
jgi:hypothetical protein